MGGCFGKCFGKCCKSSLPNIRLNIISNCCKLDRHDLILHSDADFEKLREIIKELNHSSSIKISKK